MPHRAPRLTKPPKYGTRFSVRKVAPTETRPLSDDEAKSNLVIPKSIAGKLPAKRFAEIRSMKGIDMGYFAALCWLAEKGKIPMQLLYTGSRQQLHRPEYRSAVKKIKGFMQTKWLEMRAERMKELDKAKKTVAKKIKKGEIEIPPDQMPSHPPAKRKTIKGLKKQPKTPADESPSNS